MCTLSLQDQREATYDNVERRMARTADELQEEEEAEEEEMSDSDEEETVPYNPKNLPLGWDGKVGVAWWAWPTSVVRHVHMQCI